MRKQNKTKQKHTYTRTPTYQYYLALFRFKYRICESYTGIEYGTTLVLINSAFFVVGRFWSYGTYRCDTLLLSSSSSSSSSLLLLLLLFVVLTLTRVSRNQVRGHRTGSSHSGAEEYPREKHKHTEVVYANITADSIHDCTRNL